MTGSGKTEIYITLADECLRNGRSVLCLVPEIALSRQIQKRLEAHFPDRLLVYHSKQTAAHKREVYERVASCTECSEPYVILGLRSALFLPYRNLGLIIVDEEHDTSYKQTDQAPRYHGRDSGTTGLGDTLVREPLQCADWQAWACILDAQVFRRR